MIKAKCLNFMQLLTRAISFEIFAILKSITFKETYKTQYNDDAVCWGGGFDSHRGHWNFSLTLSFRPHYDPGLDVASNRNEYQGYIFDLNVGRCVGLTTLPYTFADFLEIREPHLQEITGPVKELFSRLG